MPRSDVVLALSGLLVVVGAWVHYFGRIAAAAVPRRPIAHAAMFVLGSLAAIAALVWAPLRGQAISLFAIAALPISLGGALLFLGLWAHARVPAVEPSFAIGSSVPRVRAWTHRGEPFDSAAPAVRGQRILLKFFRGHW